MGSRIISIYCHHHPTEYWYDIDNRLKDKRDFVEAQTRGRGIMHINNGDDVYILCRYGDRCEIKYKCSIAETYMDTDGEDPYEHNSDGYVASYYFKEELIHAYESGCFPLENIRKLGLVSRHYQLNGDKVSVELLNYIKKNQIIIEEF